MSDLGDDTRALLKAAREEALPPGDKARLRAAIAAKIVVAAPITGPSAPLPAPPSPPAGGAAPASLLTGKAILAGTAIGVVAFIGGFFAGRSSVDLPAAPPRTPVEAPAPPASSSPPQDPRLATAWPAPPLSPVQSEPVATAEITAPIATTPAKTLSASAPRSLPRSREIAPSPPARDSADLAGSASTDLAGSASTDLAGSAAPPTTRSTLAAEMALLREAEAAMNGGDPSRALARLDDLGARYPGGQLREERLAARVLALCAAGRAKEARVEADQLLREVPGSVHAERIRASCAFRKKSE